MDDSDGYERDELDDIIDGTDTDTATSTTTTTTTTSSITSSMFDRNPLILELHDLQKDEPVIERKAEAKVKKLKKKLKGPAVIKRDDSSSSSEPEDGSFSRSFIDEPTTEEYFDARESYDGLSANQIPSATAERVASQVESEQFQEPKVIEPPVQRRSRPPSTAITKPVRHSE